jgi:hypothetical protein
VLLVASLLQTALGFTTVAGLPLNPTRVALAYLVAAVIASIFLGAAAASPSPLKSWTTARRTVMTVLALVSPLAVVVFLRLGIHSCTVLNLLGLPWPSGLRVAVSIISGLTVVAAVWLVIRGFRLAELRGAAIFLTIYASVVALPTLFVFLLTVYGDPGPGCIPG